ncbi:hypothetical protein RJT34_18206 [Clitoria ternatea]|uniref:Uncharacterized protein n=1 Tax=Clitoria ternatea TaxID=43366 RepID=A0AAN9JAC3_CLITE
MDRWSGVLRVPLHHNSRTYHRVGASLCLSPETRTLSVPVANAIFFCGDRVEGTGNPVIERLSNLQKLSEIVVSKFGPSVNAWVIEASVFNGPFAVYKDFIPSLNQYGEPRSYHPTGFPASTSTVSLLSNCLEDVKNATLGRQVDKQPDFTFSSCFNQPKTIILGFSKGGTVLNQILTELGFSDIGSNVKSPDVAQPEDRKFSRSEEICWTVPKTKEGLLNSISEIHYVDVGLNSTGAYLTNPDVFERISKRLIQGASPLRFILHGTPRQWSDRWRDWIRNEKDKMLHLLESEAHKSRGKLEVCTRYYFADKPPNMQMHFEIIESLDEIILDSIYNKRIMAMNTFFKEGKGLSTTQMLNLVMNRLYEGFLEKDTKEFDGFNVAILDTFNTINMALPGKRYVAPSHKDVKDWFIQWEKAKCEDEKKIVFTRFIEENVNINKADESMLITAIVAPSAAMVAKKSGQKVPQLTFMNAIPDVLFVPSATILALIATKILRLMFMRKTSTTSNGTTRQTPSVEEQPAPKEPPQQHTDQKGKFCALCNKHH